MKCLMLNIFKNILKKIKLFKGKTKQMCLKQIILQFFTYTFVSLLILESIHSSDLNCICIYRRKIYIVYF